MDNTLNAQNGTITIPTSDTVSTGTQSHVITGLGRVVMFTTANMEDTDSTNIVIVETGKAVNGTVFASGTVAESTTFALGSVFPMHGTVEIRALAEGTQSGARSIPYTILYETYV